MPAAAFNAAGHLLHAMKQTLLMKFWGSFPSDFREALIVEGNSIIEKKSSNGTQFACAVF
jgi:hypothetical protein